MKFKDLDFLSAGIPINRQEKRIDKTNTNTFQHHKQP